MRDRKQDQKIFDRMLGSEWLNKYVEASHYGDPSFPSNENPELFFTRFLQENQDKRLIILDGCRDESFFQRIIDLFYIHGELDVEVTFRATFSTRRLNLERREIALESIKRHLDFLENPVLEDTQLYQEGVVILYDLNNSISCRLDEMEVKEVFEKKKIDSWGDLIRIGDFHQAPKSMKLSEEKLLYEEEEFTYRIETLPDAIIQPFVHQERKFKTVLNNDLTIQPNLLQIIEADDLKPQQIKFYAQDQIAGFGAESAVFVLSFSTNHIFFASFAGITGMTLRGRDIFLIDSSCELKQISFERNQLASFGKTDSPASSITSFLRNKIATGHNDGTVRVWDFAESKLNTFHAHSSPVTSLAVDHKGCIYSGGLDNSFRKWDMESRKANILHGSWSNIPAIKLYPGGKILMLSEELTSPDKIHILDFKNAQHRVVYSAFEERISAINVYFDGRIVAALQPLSTNERIHKNNLLIIAPSKDECSYKQIDGHIAKTIDCFTMGPKIISCGIENDDIHTLRVWGTEFYVDMELKKLRLQPF